MELKKSSFRKSNAADETQSKHQLKNKITDDHEYGHTADDHRAYDHRASDHIA